MRKFWKALPLLVFGLTILTAGKTYVAQAAASPLVGLEGQENKVAEGELVKVDMENQTLTIKVKSGEEIQFQYDSKTTVEGRENGIQGLSSEAGSDLTVHYTEASGKKMATKIAIKKSGA